MRWSHKFAGRSLLCVYFLVMRAAFGATPAAAERSSTMFCRRMSVSKMAEVAAAAARQHCPGVDAMNVAVAAAVAVHATTPDKAPARAAEAAAQANASGAVCTAIAAGVAAASEGLRFATCQKAASEAFDAFSANSGADITVKDLADKVAGNVHGVSSVYAAVEAAAAAAYAASLPSPPRDNAIVNVAAVAAANAALAAARAFEGSESSFYTATAATRAATFRGVGRRSSLKAAVKAALPPCASPTTDPAYIDAAVIAEASASFGSKQPEALPDDNKRTYEALQTLMVLDTFLAGFLLNSLTGGPEGRELLNTEETLILGETAAFGVLFGATVSAAMFLLVTSRTRALSAWDLIVPGFLSVVGISLVIWTVALSSANALGISIDDASEVDASLYRSFLLVFFLGLLVPAYPALVTFCFAIIPSMWNWFLSRISSACR